MPHPENAGCNIFAPIMNNSCQSFSAAAFWMLSLTVSLWQHVNLMHRSAKKIDIRRINPFNQEVSLQNNHFCDNACQKNCCIFAFDIDSSQKLATLHWSVIFARLFQYLKNLSHNALYFYCWLFFKIFSTLCPLFTVPAIIYSNINETDTVKKK